VIGGDRGSLPQLVVLLSGEGVNIELDGNIALGSSGTSSTFPAIPDVPITSFELNLPQGPHSALSAAGNLCSAAQSMPTTITGQNGATLIQTTPVTVTGCAASSSKRLLVRVSAHGHTATLTVRAPGAGVLRVSGPGIRGVTRHVRKAGLATLTVGLTPAAARAAKHNHNLAIQLHISYTPQSGRSAAQTVTLRFH
jgi:hypothetical protein